MPRVPDRCCPFRESNPILIFSSYWIDSVSGDMTTTARAPILIAPLALVAIISLTVSLNASLRKQRDLTRELHELTDANQVLRRTLGDMTVAVTDKEKQIDRMLESSCQVPQGQHEDFRSQRRKLEALGDNTQATER